MSKKLSKRSQGPRGRVNLNAAGIDLGARSHYVALPPERGVDVRQFGCFTPDLEEMAEWMKSNDIKTVAMESTGVYWVPVFQMLEKHGFEVHLVSTRHLKSVPGRKTDVVDCQWIQHLHECGLLRGSFRPADAICVVRGYVRHRDTLGEESARHVLRMQKVLEQMNLQLHKVVSDITGETGMAIIDAILKGERDGRKLAALRNFRCHNSEEQIARALVGDFRDELLFCLQQEVDAYRFVQSQIVYCDEVILARLKGFEAKAEPQSLPKPKNRKDNPEVRLALFRAAGVDLTLIPGLGPKNLQTILAEVGFDLSRFPNEKAFASWATLAPHNFITGGKRKRAPQAGASRVADAFRVAAQSLANSKTALGAFYRRMRGRKGGPFAVAVTAHKLAKLFYRMLKHGQQYVERGVDYYQGRYKAQQVRAALKTLVSHGYQATLQPIPSAVP
jgi:transposase